MTRIAKNTIQGDALTVEFTVLNIHCLGLNGGPAFKHDEAFSLNIAAEDQAETERAFAAMKTMKKFDIAVIEAAVRC